MMDDREPNGSTLYINGIYVLGMNGWLVAVVPQYRRTVSQGICILFQVLQQWLHYHTEEMDPSVMKHQLQPVPNDQLLEVIVHTTTVK